jgi:DNA-binding NtrC family response regulator
VRELENFVERAAALSTNQRLEPIDFPTQLSTQLNPSRTPGGDELVRKRRVVPLAEMEKHAILNAVTEAKGDKLLAARMLGMGKTTLYRKLKQYERRRESDALQKIRSI